ncbi:hypothetical protein [Halofilum ochraceum]|uniref:hypothetical protein n=1 Tax=Halofilum ochraceum TaxID=1611323 RepID=UPI00082B4336|nr:hypothetical protein [Halofilum ochraceum]
MHDRELERELQRINGEGTQRRALCASLALGLIAAAVLASDTPTTSFLLVLAAVFPAGVWLRRYNRARPRHGAAVYDLAAGAFLGALMAAAWIHTPESLHGWLQLPGERAAPAAVVIVMTAMLEDLARELCGKFRASD